MRERGFRRLGIGMIWLTSGWKALSQLGMAEKLAKDEIAELADWRRGKIVNFAGNIVPEAGTISSVPTYYVLVVVLIIQYVLE